MLATKFDTTVRLCTKIYLDWWHISKSPAFFKVQFFLSFKEGTGGISTLKGKFLSATAVPMLNGPVHFRLALKDKAVAP